MAEREEKQIIVTNKFITRTFERCLEPHEDFYPFQEVVFSAIKRTGKLYDHPRQPNTKKCVFFHPIKGSHYTVLVVEKPKRFIIKSVYPSNSLEVKDFQRPDKDLSGPKKE
jgi:hypothetical protein